jgi:outer membrane protein TolC
MNKYFINFLLLATFIATNVSVSGQNPKETTKYVLTLDQVINLAKEQSPQSIMAKNQFRGSYWQYRSYKADRLPSLKLNTVLPDFNRSIGKVLQDDGSEKFVDQNSVNTNANLSLNQNIPLTGGSIFVSSELKRNDNLTSNSKAYLSNPFNIGINQPLNGFNNMRWSKKIEPLKYEEARKNYCSALENVSSRAVNLFFDLALGRYNIGTIAENELLQMELSKLNAGTEVNQAKIDLAFKKSQIRSFLGYNERVEIEIVLPNSTPQLQLNVDSVLSLALQNNPNVIMYQRQLLESERDVARARSEKGLKADLYASYGSTAGNSSNFNEAYSNPKESQMVRVGLTIPLLDWGLQKGKYKMAQSNRDVVKTNVEQANIDFQQEIYLKVMQFNLQNDQLFTASKADTVAQLRFNVIKQRFLIGKINVTDFNIAVSEKDIAKRGYISTLRNYWSFFYDIRKTTLFDFVVNKPITVNFDELVQ